MDLAGRSNAADESWEPLLYTNSESDTLHIQGEIYLNDSHPIICIGLEDDQMTDLEIAQVQGTSNKHEQAHIRKCIYMVNTLTAEEAIEYGNLETPEEATGFLSTLVEDVEAGTRPMRVYYPPEEPAQDARTEPEMTPSQRREQKAKWLKDNSRLIIQVATRGPGDVPTRRTRQIPKYRNTSVDEII